MKAGISVLLDIPRGFINDFKNQKSVKIGKAEVIRKGKN